MHHEHFVEQAVQQGLGGLARKSLALAGHAWTRHRCRLCAGTVTKGDREQM